MSLALPATQSRPTTPHNLHERRFPSLSLLLALTLLPVLACSQDSRLTSYQPISAEELRNPSPEDWLMWRRTYDVAGHSPLDLINRDNVQNLRLAWSLPLNQGGNMTTPLVRDGVLFIADTGNVLRALDAASGEELWQYQHDEDNLDGRRIGIALHGDRVIVPHNDLDLVALDARSGEVVWKHAINTPVDAMNGPGYYSLRGAPLIVDGMIIQGVGATLVPEGGFILGIDLETGAEHWRFNTIARPGEPGGNTWNDLPLEQRSGGSVWIPGSYDPELDLVYFGTAPTYDTAPLLEELGRDDVSNAALYTNTTLALRPRTGELVWHFQHMPNDQWDLDWVYERQLGEAEIDGQSRKVVFTAGKMALYDILDARSGDYLDSVDTGVTNMIAGIDPMTGDKRLSPIARPSAETGNVLCPYLLGGRNWQAASHDREEQMVYLPLSEMCMMGGPTGTNSSLLSSGVALDPIPRPDSDGNYGRIQAIDMENRELAWSHRELTPPTIAALSTEGGLLFTGFLDQSFKALDAASGEVLWETSLEHLPSSFPITYAVDNRQYVAVVRGQPSRFIGSLYGIISNLLEGENALAVPETGPALMVYSLED